MSNNNGDALRQRLHEFVGVGGCVVLSGTTGVGKTVLAKAALEGALYIDRVTGLQRPLDLTGHNAVILDETQTVAASVLLPRVFQACTNGLGVVLICQNGFDDELNDALVNTLRVAAPSKPILRLHLDARSQDCFTVRERVLKSADPVKNVSDKEYRELLDQMFSRLGVEAR